MQILQAILFMFLIWAIDKAIVYSRQQTPAFAQVQHPASAAVRNIPACRQNTYLQVQLTSLHSIGVAEPRKHSKIGL